MANARRGLVLICAALTLGACGASRPLLREAPDTALSDPAEVARWENLARPDFLAVLGTLIAIAEDPRGSCPAVQRDDAFVLVRGGCTDDEGVRHTGSARITVTDDKVRARVRDYGEIKNGKTTTITGTVVLTHEGPPTFSLNLRIDAQPDLNDLAPGATWLAIDAEGRKDEAGRWAMEGELAAEHMGRVRARATDIVLDDDRCSSEPLSGQLELWSGEHHVQIGYDGATDCDPEGTAAWWRDGQAKGELSGVSGGADCSVAPGRRGPGTMMGLLLLGLLGLRRRRARA